MMHIITIMSAIDRPLDYKIKHEYWDEEVYNLPKSDKDRKPYYVCYTYPTPYIPFHFIL